MTLVEIFRRDISEDFLHSVVLGLRDAYSSAFRSVQSEYGEQSVRENVIPWVRRAKVEEMLKAVAVSHNLQAETKKVGSWNHVEVRRGQVLLTQSRTVTDRAFVRPAEWKNAYAKKTQKLLFSTNECEGEVFATLIHGHATNGRLDFAIIKFPKTDEYGVIDSFFDGSIDLMEYVFDELVESEPATVADTAIPVLRRDIDQLAE